MIYFSLFRKTLQCLKYMLGSAVICLYIKWNSELKILSPLRKQIMLKSASQTLWRKVDGESNIKLLQIKL